MQIPPTTKCFQLMTEIQMNDTIADHSLMVYKVALFLTDQLISKGVPLNRDIVSSGSLLHDITKTRSLNTHEDHAETGDGYLQMLGYPEVGSVVRQHVRLDTYDIAKPVSEADIVNYADKRVINDTMVPLSVRMHYLIARYGNTPVMEKNIILLWKQTMDLEKKLFNVLRFMPDRLNDKMNNESLNHDFNDYLRPKEAEQQSLECFC